MSSVQNYVMAVRHWFAAHSRVVFWLILALSAFLLLFRISQRALWMDETAVLEYLRQDPLTFLIEYFKVPDNHPPLYYLLVIIVYRLAPNGELGVRLLSVMAGLGMVVTVYYFAWLLFESKSRAFLAMLLTSCSAFFILISQMARYHSLAALFSLLTLYFFCSLMKRGWNARWWWLFIVCGALVGWTDYPHFIYVVLTVNAYVGYQLLRRRRLPFTLRRWLMGQIALAVSFLPMILLIFRRVFNEGDGGFNKVNQFSNGIFHLLAATLMHPYVFFFSENIFPWNFAIFIPGVVILLYLLLVLVRMLIRGNGSTSSCGWPLYLFVALVIGNVVLMNFADPRYNFIVYPKYGFVALPLFILLLVSLLQHVSQPMVRAVLVIGMVAVDVYGLSNFYQVRNYLNASYFNSFRGLEYVRDHARPGDRLVINGDANSGVYAFYQSKYFSKVQPMSLAELTALAASASGAQQLTPEKIWFFTTASDEGNMNNTTASKIPSGFTSVDHFYSTPLDPTLRFFKQQILHRPSYEYKNSVFLLTPTAR